MKVDRPADVGQMVVKEQHPARRQSLDQCADVLAPAGVVSHLVQAPDACVAIVRGP